MNAGFLGFSIPRLGNALIHDQVLLAPAPRLSVEGISQSYKNLVIDAIVRSAKTGATSDTLGIVLNDDYTAGNYRRHIYYNLTVADGDDNTIGNIDAADAPAYYYSNFRLTILDYASIYHTHYVQIMGTDRRAATDTILWWGWVHWEKAEPIISIRLVNGGYNFVEGSVMRVWGEG